MITMMSYDQVDGQTSGEVGSLATDDEDRQLDNVTLAKNLAEDLDKDLLNKIGFQCKQGFDVDVESRKPWEQKVKDWQKLALQIQDEKSWPWPGAANVKYPLLSTAAMQFAARAYPSLVPSNKKVVQSVVVGKDPTGEKQAKADRVSTYMSYQVMEQIPYWEEEMDKLLIMLPICGSLFKKTFYNKEEERADSRLVLPMNMVVNYWTKCVEEAERISEIIEYSPRALKEKQLQGIYLDVDLGPAPTPERYDEHNLSTDEDTTPYEIVEQHTYYDIDDDGYAEPVIVTFERSTGTVLRVSIRYYLDDVTRNDKNKIVKIKPITMYTKFPFVPSPDGSFYDVGFGTLLGPLNESVNTVINQLLDSGTLNNLNGGFIGKALRLRAGDTSFIPGEWKPVNATGDDLKKQIVPLPAKEPSAVLLELLKFLVQAGKELASVAEIFTGKMPGQNTPATTTMATVEQGMKVFTAVYKRIFRSLSEEFYKIFVLNGKYLDPNQYVNVLDAAIGPDDFDSETVDICPGADPTATSQNEKLQKAQGLAEINQMFPGLLDPIKVAVRLLEAMEQPNYQELFSQAVQQSGQLPPPPPDPKVQALQMKAQIDQQKMQADIAQKQQEMELDARDRQQQMMMAQQEHAQKMQFEQEQGQMKMASELQNARAKMAVSSMQTQQQMVQGEATHQQTMRHSEEQSKLKTQSQNGKSKTGSPAQQPKSTSKK
jgi:chaperonin GroES